jgi:hypothetical protein
MIVKMKGSKAKRKGKSGVQASDSLSTSAPGNFGSISRYPTGFPKRMIVTHKYVEVVQLAATAGLPATYIFSANGMYDPNITGTGHQPMYFDNLCAIYDHYTVFRSRIKYQVVSQAHFRCAAYIDDDPTVVTDPTAAAEQPSGAKFALSPYSTTTPYKTQLSWKAADYFGGDVWDNDALSGTNAANPVEQSYFVIQLQEAAGAGTVNASVAVEIEYEAGWDELKTQAAN